MLLRCLVVVYSSDITLYVVLRLSLSAPRVAHPFGFHFQCCACGVTHGAIDKKGATLSTSLVSKHKTVIFAIH
jgi:hypothetical protein